MSRRGRELASTVRPSRFRRCALAQGPNGPIAKQGRKAGLRPRRAAEGSLAKQEPVRSRARPIMQISGQTISMMNEKDGRPSSGQASPKGSRRLLAEGKLAIACRDDNPGRRPETNDENKRCQQAGPGKEPAEGREPKAPRRAPIASRASLRSKLPKASPKGLAWRWSKARASKLACVSPKGYALADRKQFRESPKGWCPKGIPEMRWQFRNAS